MSKKLAILASIVALCICKPVNYLQCDSKWKDVNFGKTQSTICQRGDLLTVISMQSAGCGIKIDNQIVTPLSMNNWLTKEDGIRSDFSIDIDALKGLDFKVETATDKI